MFSTTLLTVDNKEVIIPNGKIIADSIVNYPPSYRRIDLRTLGVACHSQISHVKQVIQALIDDEKRIDHSRVNTVRLIERAGSLNFTIRVWVKNASIGTPISIFWKISNALDENNILLAHRAWILI